MYPGARHTRFEHSLGTSKLVNVYLTNVFNNSEEAVLKEYLEKLRENLGVIFEKAGIIKRDGEKRCKFKGISRSKHEVFKRIFCEGDVNDFKEYLIHSMEKCMLVHDIGHLVYSHTFERSLVGTILRTFVSKAFGSSHAKLHEYIGYQIILILTQKGLLEKDETIFFFLIHPEILLGINRTLIDDTTGFSYLLNKKGLKKTPVYSFFKLIYGGESHGIKENEEIKEIIEDKQGLLGVLHFLVDSAIDCDRFDYLMRDSHSSGQTSLSFHDIVRLMDLASLEIEKKENGKEFQVSFDKKALSMLQNYIHSLYQERAWEIYHHKSVAFDELIAKMIDAFIFENFQKFVSKHKSRNYLIKVEAEKFLDIFSTIAYMRGFYREVGLERFTEKNDKVDRGEKNIEKIKEKLKKKVLGNESESKKLYVNLDWLIKMDEKEILHIKHPSFNYKALLLRQRNALSMSIFKSFVDYKAWKGPLVNDLIDEGANKKKEKKVPDEIINEKKPEWKEALENKISEVFKKLDLQQTIEAASKEKEDGSKEEKDKIPRKEFSRKVKESIEESVDEEVKKGHMKRSPRGSFFFIIKMLESEERFDEQIHIKNDDEGGYNKYELGKLSEQNRFKQPFVSFYCDFNGYKPDSNSIKGIKTVIRKEFFRNMKEYLMDELNKNWINSLS